MANHVDNLFAHAMELARAVPGSVVIAGVLVGVAVFVTSYLLYQLAVRIQSEPSPTVVYVMPYPVLTAAPLQHPELRDRESCIETGPMSVVTVARPSPPRGAARDVPPVVVEMGRGMPATALQRSIAGERATTWNSAN